VSSPIADRRDPRSASPTASAEEAAAIVAAIERFRRATTATATGGGEPPDRWLAAAILEGISREPNIDAPTPWINT
jgi:hypothetical protein